MLQHSSLDSLVLLAVPIGRYYRILNSHQVKNKKEGFCNATGCAGGSNPTRVKKVLGMVPNQNCSYTFRLFRSP